ncbi:DUF3039 domain-containing protein [Nocardia sp. NPDC058666]|uniref:DUF3039 domain-containing protein n=1 Tax=Nocardia sp. NPDC058666 TaxID=3346587 RepID=UPI003668669B
MPPHRRARPTVRVLAEDLFTDWTEPHAMRAVVDGRWRDLHPLSELPHPLLRKAAQLYGPDPAHDPPPRLIACSGDLKLQELRNAQWRAGLWTDPETGVRWVCAAGLAKGGHKDGADFYQWLGAMVERTDGAALLPTELDRTLHKIETTAWLITQWELRLQDAVAVALNRADENWCCRLDLPHPVRADSMGSAQLTVAVVEDCEELVVEFDLDSEFAASELGWLLTVRVLVSLSPPVQSWDRYGASYSTIAELGYRAAQRERLQVASAREELLAQELGTVSHRVHTQHLAAATVDGRASRALCGVFFVPMQDHAEIEECVECAERLAYLPR